MDKRTLHKLAALLQMNPARGATQGEWANAKAAIVRIAARFGITDGDGIGPWLRSLGLRVGRGSHAAQEAAQAADGWAESKAWNARQPKRAGFEYRQCYKPTCRCMRGGPWHGPYKYSKRRTRGRRNPSSHYEGRG